MQIIRFDVKILDMTTTVTALPTKGERANATIRATVLGLMAGKRLTKEEIAPRVGLSAATLYRHLSDRGATPFKAGTLAELADVLGVSIADLYSGLGGTFTPPEGEESGRRDSNPQHSAWKVAAFPVAA